MNKETVDKYNRIDNLFKFEKKIREILEAHDLGANYIIYDINQNQYHIIFPAKNELLVTNGIVRSRMFDKPNNIKDAFGNIIGKNSSINYILHVSDATYMISYDSDNCRTMPINIYIILEYLKDEYYVTEVLLRLQKLLYQSKKDIELDTETFGYQIKNPHII